LAAARLSFRQVGAITAAIGAKSNRQSPGAAPRGGVDVWHEKVSKLTLDQARSGGTGRRMSTLQAARLRLEAALERLEAALGAGGGPVQPARLPGESELVLGRDLELMRAECDRLRRALEAAEARNRRLAEAADEVAGRLDRSIGELAELVES
jgi:hypothetical protein